MKINQIEITNFKALRGTHTFELPPGIIGIVGDNGQGKSTLTTAISWGLYGPNVFPRRVTSADTVTWGEDAASVALSFVMGGEEWELTRTYRKGSSNAHLKGPESADGSDAVTNAITSIMGIDYVGFLASVFSRQTDLAGLASLSGPDRTKTVLRLRGLDQITKGIDAVSEVARESKKSLNSIRAALPDPRPISEYDRQIKDITGRLDRLDIEEEELRQRQAEINAEVTDLVSKQESLASKRKAFIAYVNEKAKRESTLKAKTDALEAAKAAALAPKPDRPVTPKVTADRKKFAALSQKQAEDREYVRTLIAKLQAKDTCPSCGRKYDDAEELAKVKETAAAEKAKAERRIAKREEDLNDLSDALEAEQAYQRLIVQWEGQVAAWERLQQAVGAAEKAVEAAESQVATLIPVEDAGEAYDALVVATREAQNRAAEVREKLATLTGQASSLELQLVQLELEKDQAIEMAGKVGRIEKTALESEFTVTQLKDFKRLQTERLAPDISLKASDLLSQLTDGKYTELILTPEWDIQYRYENGDVKEFHNLSVGERNTFALALRLALADLRASNIGLLVLDEVLDALDESRQNLTWGTLESLLGRYEQILVITHVSGFKERAPHIIQL